MSTFQNNNGFPIDTEDVLKQFLEIYDVHPQWIVGAPGRVNLIGEHVDYCDGFVLPAAIDRYVVIAGARCESNAFEFHSVQKNETIVIPVDHVLAPGIVGWHKYLAGVIEGFRTRSIDVPPFRAMIFSSVPPGGGLASSAALEVALATLLEKICDIELGKLQKALLCQTAEHQFAKVPCGIMDQYSSIFGKEDSLLLLDCQAYKHRLIEFESAKVSLLVINSNVDHELSGSEYGKRRAELEVARQRLGVSSFRELTMSEMNEYEHALLPNEFKRVRHVVSETQRTLRAAELIKARQWEAVGKLMFESHDSLQSDYEVSCDELDLLVEIARRIGKSEGVWGCRMTGGGFGGCVIALVATEQLESVSERICVEVECKTGITPTPMLVRPSRGAQMVKF